MMKGYVPNQGDGWAYTLAYLERFLEAAPSPQNPHGGYLTLMQTLATRTAELHRAFAISSGDPAFEPEPIAATDFEAWKAKVRQEANDTLAMMERLKKPNPSCRKRAKLPLHRRLRAPKAPASKTRHHGDYHLGRC